MLIINLNPNKYDFLLYKFKLNKIKCQKEKIL